MDHRRSLLELPDELLLEIASYLDIANDLPSMAQTCQRLKSIALDEVFWTTRLLKAGVASMPAPLEIGAAGCTVNKSRPTFEPLHPLAESSSNKMLVRDPAIANSFWLYRITSSPYGSVFVTNGQRSRTSVLEGSWRNFYGLNAAVCTIQGAFRNFTQRLSLRQDSADVDPGSLNCPRYALTGPGLDSQRTKKLVAGLLADQQYNHVTTSSFQRRNQQERLFARNLRIANFPSGGGIFVRTGCGPAEVLTLYGNSARLRNLSGANVTSRQRLEHSRMHMKRQDVPEEYVVTEGISALCNDCDGVLFAVDGSTDPSNVETMDGLELRALLRPLHRDMPVLILNCQEDSKAQVVSNDELASKLGAFNAPNPIAIVRVDSDGVVESGHMGFAWLRLRNQLPDVPSHKSVSR